MRDDSMTPETEQFQPESVATLPVNETLLFRRWRICLCRPAHDRELNATFAVMRLTNWPTNDVSGLWPQAQRVLQFPPAAPRMTSEPSSAKFRSR